MSIWSYSSKAVVTVGPSETIDIAARLMQDQQVGSLVVVEKNKPIGIVTDRDILRNVVALHRMPETTYVDEVMTSKLITVSQHTGVFEVIHTMCEKGIRRLPVIDTDGSLTGIITQDDLLILIGNELIDLAGISINERHREKEKITMS